MSTPTLTLAELRAARDARLAMERQHLAELRQKEEEKLEHFRERLESYRITEDDKARIMARLREAFDKHEAGTPPELQLFAFPSEFCHDLGRRVVNGLEGWRETLPGAVADYFDWFERELKPGGFTSFLQVIDFKDGMPGQLGLFISWKEDGQ
jgi:hypothetical protein